MASDYAAVFSAVRLVLTQYAAELAVKTDTGNEYLLTSKSASPFPQHKGQPLQFASVRLGKAYVSYHLMPLYMCEPLAEKITPSLKKRMQGKTCFNFKTVPDAELLAELKQLTRAAFQQWSERKWL